MARRVILIQTAFLGDLLLSIPLIKRIRTQPTHLTLICREGLGKFFLDYHLVDEVYEIKKGETKSYERVLSQLKSYDLLLTPHQSVRTFLFARKIRAKIKIGFRTWWNWPFWNHNVIRRKTLPDALRQLSLLVPIDKELAEEFSKFDSDLLVTGKIPESYSMEILNSINSKANRVLIAPGSQWLTKRWTTEGFIEVASDLHSQGFEVFLIGSKDDAGVNAEISEVVAGVVDLSGKTSLTELAKLMSESLVLLCNDSGLMHLASTVGLPTVAIFGPTTLQLGYRPWNNQAAVVEQQLFCRPCGKHGHMKCPLGTHECMRSVKVEAVLKALQPWLRNCPT